MDGDSDRGSNRDKEGDRGSNRDKEGDRGRDRVQGTGTQTLTLQI